MSPNHSKQREGPGIRAAATLLLGCLLSIPLVGCLIPQDDQVQGELPPRRNRPLRIVNQTPATALLAKFRNSNSCIGINEPFTLIVEDEDEGDVLESLWFLDGRLFQSGPILQMGGIRRQVAGPTISDFAAALANLRPDLPHVLTAYVTDSKFIGEGENSAVSRKVTLPNGDEVTDQAYVDRFSWVLNVVPDPCP